MSTLADRIEALLNEAAGWRPYESCDTGSVYLSETVDDLLADLRAALAEAGPDAGEGQGDVRGRAVAAAAAAMSDDPEVQQWAEPAADAVLAVVGRTVGAEEAWDQGYRRGKADHCDYSPSADECDTWTPNPYRTVTEGGEQDG